MEFTIIGIEFSFALVLRLTNCCSILNLFSLQCITTYLENEFL